MDSTKHTCIKINLTSCDKKSRGVATPSYGQIFGVRPARGGCQTRSGKMPPKQRKIAMMGYRSVGKSSKRSLFLRSHPRAQSLRLRSFRSECSFTVSIGTYRSSGERRRLLSPIVFGQRISKVNGV